VGLGTRTWVLGKVGLGTSLWRDGAVAPLLQDLDQEKGGFVRGMEWGKGGGKSEAGRGRTRKDSRSRWDPPAGGKTSLLRCAGGNKREQKGRMREKRKYMVKVLSFLQAGAATQTSHRKKKCAGPRTRASVNTRGESGEDERGVVPRGPP